MPRNFPFLPGCVVVLVAALASASDACNTPVNRYALYRWPPSSYELFLLHRGGPGEAEAATLRALENALATTGDRPVANLSAIPVDMADTERLAAFPAGLRRELEQISAESLPRWVLYNPKGGRVHVGALSVDDVPALLDSPARRQVAKLLEEGRDGVLVLLRNGDTAASDRARKEVEAAVDMMVARAPSGARTEDMVARAPSGARTGDTVVPAPQGAREEDRAETGEEGIAARPLSSASAGLEPASLRVGFLELSRDDPSETWFVRCLLATQRLEPGDLEHPMVFAIYGRARAMPPYIGAGIEARNLLDVIDFINGPCSCQVKDENPGIDLISTWDWESTAATIARRIGEETGNEHLLGDRLIWDISALSPIALDAPAATDGGAAEAAGSTEVPDGAGDASGVAGAARDEAGAQDRPENAPPTSFGEARAPRPEPTELTGNPGESSTGVNVGLPEPPEPLGVDDAPAAASAGETEESEPGTRPPGRTRWLVLVGGLGVALIVFVAATVRLWRRQGAGSSSCS